MKYTTAVNDLRNGLIVTAAIMAFAIIAGYFAFQSLAYGYSPWQVLAASWAPGTHALEKTGEPVIAALEQYREEQGRYPSNLSEAKICSPNTFFGRHRYRVNSDQTAFTLVIGDYGRYKWEIRWQSGASGWTYDG